MRPTVVTVAEAVQPPLMSQDGAVSCQILGQGTDPLADSGQIRVDGRKRMDTPYYERICEQYEQFLPKLDMNTATRWTQLSNVLQKFDDNQSTTNNENIDTLLVFAGLFSAVLTAFIVEAIKLLEPDSEKLSVQILIQISQQLGSFSTNPGFINSTHLPIAPSPTFTPATSSLWVNALWFAALIFSLITGSLGMLVKQWLREYQSNPRVSPEEHRRVRLFRVRGLRNHGVLEIASFLPLLLQIALVLFFIGLALFVYSIHPSIGWFVVTLVVTWFLFLGASTIMPIFSPSCPYKTPFLNAAFFRFREFLNIFYLRVASIASRKEKNDMHPVGFEPSLFVEEADAALETTLDSEVQLDARDTFRDIKVWEMIACCVDLDFPLESLTRLVAIVEKKLGSPIDPSSKVRGCFRPEEWDLLLQSMITCVRKRLLNAPWSGLTIVDLNAFFVLEDASTLTSMLLQHMSMCISRGAFSVPWESKPLRTLILWKLGFQEARVPRTISHENMNFITKASDLLLDASTYDPGMNKIPFQNIVELCRTVFQCATRCEEDSRESMKNDFMNLVSSLADVLTRMSTPSDPTPEDVFRCHFALDMALKTHKLIPGIISDTLFAALHLHSVKMFDKLLAEWHWSEGYLREGPVDISQAPIAPTGEIDWRKMAEDRVRVEVRDPGGYGEEWEYWRTRFDCERRMELVLNFHSFRDGLLEVLEDS